MNSIIEKIIKIDSDTTQYVKTSKETIENKKIAFKKVLEKLRIDEKNRTKIDVSELELEIKAKSAESIKTIHKLNEKNIENFQILYEKNKDDIIETIFNSMFEESDDL